MNQGDLMLIDDMKRLPFKKAAFGWLKMRVDRNEISPKMAREYTREIETLDRFFHNKKLPAITPDNVKDFQYRRGQEVYRTNKSTNEVTLVGRNTINKEGNLLCQLRSYIGMPFGKAYTAIKKQRGLKKKVGRALTDQERAHLLHVGKTGPKDQWWGPYLFAKIALNTSARPGEVTHIQISDIDLPEKIVHICGTKTDGSDRYEPLNAEAFDAVVEAIERLKSLTKHLGPIQPEWYLFPFLIQKTKKHDPTQPQVSFRRAWESMRDAAGLPWLRQNDLRHTVASAMAHDPLTSQETTRKIMGHETAKMTEHYQHLEMQKKREAFDRLLRRKQKRYEKRPAREVVESDPELTSQMAGMFKSVLKNLLTEMQEGK